MEFSSLEYSPVPVPREVGAKARSSSADQQFSITMLLNASLNEVAFPESFNQDDMCISLFADKSNMGTMADIRADEEIGKVLQYPPSNFYLMNLRTTTGYGGYQYPAVASGEWTNSHLELDPFSFLIPKPLNDSIPQTSQQHHDPQLQRRLLQFLMDNLNLLTSLSDYTPGSMTEIRDAFEIEELQFQQYNSGPIHARAALDRIFQRFRPVVGTPSTREESNNRMAHKSEPIFCPFRFCGGHFTRIAGLRTHPATVPLLQEILFRHLYQTTC
ncbi:hypothetical protein BDN70DRAFT_929125 [Pholiota conissans]|uniref:Uncharacterized protein n=1 Tax=Pholiota conissans TaxID=109636 RepID=A0A9P6D4K9_9AGAR|nr:hypothetical protein BDN70DRAFT_929125 [Pholiota conissans]